MDREPMFARHVRKRYQRLDELAAAAEAVQATLESRGWAVIEGLLSAELEALDRELDDPRRVLEQAVYAAKHAHRGGLKGARQAAETLIGFAADRLEEAERQEADVPVGAGAGG